MPDELLKSMEESMKNVRVHEIQKEPCDDAVSRQAAINALGEKPLNWTDSLEEIYAEQTWIDNVEALKSIPSIGAVSIEVYKQVVWERDIAIGQLKELGYSLGEKIQNPM